jgi:hypothetical protein
VEDHLRAAPRWKVCAHQQGQGSQRRAHVQAEPRRGAAQCPHPEPDAGVTSAIVVMAERRMKPMQIVACVRSEHAISLSPQDVANISRPIVAAFDTNCCGGARAAPQEDRRGLPRRLPVSSILGVPSAVTPLWPVGTLTHAVAGCCRCNWQRDMMMQDMPVPAEPPMDVTAESLGPIS